MKRNYLKIVLCVLCPLLVVGFVYLNGYPDDQAIFMKGRVAEVHAYMEGKCMKCHVPWKGVSNSACVQCHVDDRHYLNNRLDKAVAGRLRCFDCHQEHRGRSYDLEAAGYLVLN
jgi:hypothetical protein